jgi:tricarballylate dehydrogenase
MLDVLIIGGGNAALCAALKARELGASVMLLESAPKEWRGGNSSHTRNIRAMHEAPQDVMMDIYSEEEYWQDVLKVTSGFTDEKLARMMIRQTQFCRSWMTKYGVRFQAPLSGTLNLSRTNAFFMGGGKALVNAYYRSAEKLGIQIRYNATVNSLILEDGEFVAACVGDERIEAKSCVIASGGFESNIPWLKEAWGINEHGEAPADNFIVRGTKYNQGVLLKDMIAQGVDTVSDAKQAHMVAVDARAPLYDGGICTRVDCVSFGIVVNQDAQRFSDEGEDFWPKRYAFWGRLVAQQPGQIGYCIIDSKVLGRFMPPVFPGEKADTLEQLANQLGLSQSALRHTVQEYNAACQVGKFDHTILDDCHTDGLVPAKTHWALPIDTGPFYGYSLRPGVTFTYLGLKTDETSRVFFQNKPSRNLFVAGEMMAGNILGKGYVAGIGMAIGTVFGLIAGEQAQKAAKEFHGINVTTAETV